MKALQEGSARLHLKPPTLPDGSATPACANPKDKTSPAGKVMATGAPGSKVEMCLGFDVAHKVDVWTHLVANLRPGGHTWPTELSELARRALTIISNQLPG